jgi:ubiquinol-cytochrome c reductase cytochrome b subunit
MRYPFENIFDAFHYIIMPIFIKTRPINSKYKLRGEKRIGPHDLTIYSIIFGSLLGDAHGEKRKVNGGTRISFYQESSHLSYIL